MKHLDTATVDIANCPLVVAVQSDGDVLIQHHGHPIPQVVGIIREIAYKMEAEADGNLMDATTGGPESGHQFHITVQTQGSTRVAGEQQHVDSDWVGDPIVLTVRAWNLTEALRKAAMAPLPAWNGLLDREAEEAERAAEAEDQDE